MAHLLVYAMERRLSGTFEFAEPGAGGLADALEPEGVEPVATLVVKGGFPAKVRTKVPVAYLGQVLYEHGVIDEGQMNASLMAVASKKALQGRVLMDAGALSLDALRAGLADQLARKVRHLFTLGEDTPFAFYDGVDLLSAYGGDDGGVLDPLPTLWRGVRDYPSWTHVRGMLGRVETAHGKLVAQANLARFRFDADELALAECLRSRAMGFAEFARLGIIVPQVAELLYYCLLITRQLEIVPPATITPTLTPTHVSMYATPQPGAGATASMQGATTVALSSLPPPFSGARAAHREGAAAGFESGSFERPMTVPSISPLLASPTSHAAAPTREALRPSSPTSAPPVSLSSIAANTDYASQPPPSLPVSAPPSTEPSAVGSFVTSATERPPPSSLPELEAVSMPGLPRVTMPSPMQGAQIAQPASQAPAGAPPGSQPPSAYAPPTDALRPLTRRPSQRVIIAQAGSSAPPPKYTPNGSLELSPQFITRKKQILDRVATIQKEDFFHMLGVPRTCTSEDAQRAFFKLAESWHPDKLPPVLDDMRDACGLVFSHLSEAHNVLSDERRRQKYIERLEDERAPTIALASVRPVPGTANLFEGAEICASRKEWDRAEALTARYLEDHPNHGAATALHAWARYNRSETPSDNEAKECLKLLDRALEFDWDCERAYFWRATVHRRLKNELKAIKDFRAAATLNPHNIDAAREVRLFDMRKRHTPGYGQADGAKGASSAPPAKNPSTLPPSAGRGFDVSIGTKAESEDTPKKSISGLFNKILKRGG